MEHEIHVYVVLIRHDQELEYCLTQMSYRKYISLHEIYGWQFLLHQYWYFVCLKWACEWFCYKFTIHLRLYQFL